MQLYKWSESLTTFTPDETLLRGSTKYFLF